MLEARAQFDASEHEVHVRVAGRGNRIYVDLCDLGWRAIEIDANGWRVVDDPPVYFRRSNGMKALPGPVAGGSLDDDLKPLLNPKTNDDFLLNVAWLLGALHPSGPYPLDGSRASKVAAILFVQRELFTDQDEVFLGANDPSVPMASMTL